jgi:TPR repeat protein
VELGIGAEKNPSLAVELYQRACTDGYAAGCSRLGALHVRAGRVDVGKKMLAKGCEAGDAKGCEDLATLEGAATK